MSFKWNGRQIIDYSIRKYGSRFIKNEILALIKDFARAGKGKVKLKDIDSRWKNLTRFERINKGKRFKEYIKRGYIKGVIILKDIKNHPIEYSII